MRALISNALLISTMGILSASCSGHKSQIVTKTPEEVITELSNDISIEYNSSIDRVTIKSNTESEPIILLGTRIDGEGINAKNMEDFCSLLGFTLPERVSYHVAKASTVINVKNERVSGDASVTAAGVGKNIAYPALHMKAVENSIGGMLFSHIPKMGAHYLVTPTRDEYISYTPENFLSDSTYYDENIAKKSYVDSISCEGTTSVHFDSNGNFQKDQFLMNIFNKQMGEVASSQNSSYDFNIPFLLKKADDSWRFDDYDNGKTVVMEKDAELISLADKGAKEICVQSGMTNVLFYTFEYLTSDKTGNIVYTYSDGGGWTETSAPVKFELRHVKDYAYEGTNDISVEVPGIYLDDVYCY